VCVGNCVHRRFVTGVIVGVILVAERHPVRVPVRCDVGGDVERDVTATDELPALVEVGLPREPVRR
jgi:hypothetical protein